MRHEQTLEELYQKDVKTREHLLYCLKYLDRPYDIDLYNSYVDVINSMSDPREQIAKKEKK